MKAICPGSFDPVTHGHLNIIERTATLFDDVLVAVGRNSAKNYLFSPDERVAMLSEACAGMANVQVTLLDGLLVDFCRAHDVGAIVKGLRFGGDFEFELQMAQMNHALSGIETVMLPTSARWAHLSSTMIREVAGLGGDVSQFVPDSVDRRIAAKVAERRGSGR
ncbi:pantetheine-phosphate adenylyltransferase [Nigerium massiliense]|uniref:pantetheine-phosphate adenylyltransferase n=1 Tax=Nigerium massiliense TaxID=1522317 RepID=UPI000AA8F14A|nr:pantetheine-phosphate adenylyltransferase [Nigerium massiliense]